MAGKIKEIKSEDFENTISNNRLVVVDFFSTECPPCEVLFPKLEEISKEYDNVIFVKIFRQENRELAEELSIMSSPTLLFFKDGKEVIGRLSGFIEYDDLKKRIENLTL